VMSDHKVRVRDAAGVRKAIPLADTRVYAPTPHGHGCTIHLAPHCAKGDRGHRIPNVRCSSGSELIRPDPRPFHISF
jgi:hypothetical protein